MTGKVEFSTGIFQVLVSFLHVTFNFALAFHVEASAKLVSTCCTEVTGLIRAMCPEHCMYVFPVSPCGNHSPQ